MNAHVAPPSTRTLSPQQQAVISWASTGRGSAFIEAVAGAGKTTTLIELLAVTRGSVAFAAYNTKIAAEIKAKVARKSDPNSPDFDPRVAALVNKLRVGTFHSFGFQAWRRVYPAVKSGPEASREKADMTRAKLTENKVPEGMQSFVLKLVSLAKQRAIGLHGSIDDESKWYDIVDHFDLAYEIEESEVPETRKVEYVMGDAEHAGITSFNEPMVPCTVANGVKWAIRSLKYHIALAPKIIDFDDMIYMPVVSGVKMWENDWILVDEAQDTNPCRRALARKMLRVGGRAAFVGDRAQAIYGFTGADSDAIDQIIRDFSCATFPLTVTYRCPKTVVEMARAVGVSSIEAHESAPQGVVRTVHETKFRKEFETLTAADAVLCRNTKPLVAMAYSLIKAGVACHVEGRDIGMGLLKLVNKFSARDLDQLHDKLEAHRDTQVAKLMAKGKETQAEALIDRVDTIFVIMEGCRSVDELRSKVSSLFQDSEHEKKPTLTLATAHRSKGREWGRVFILGKNAYMPSRWARQEWQIVQESNLIYVAYTRAMRELVLIDVDPV